MGQLNALQRRVEVAQQGLALFEDETRGAGARLSEAFGRIEEVLRDKDFQLVRRELEVQRLTRENAQAKMLLETLLETLEQRQLPSLKPIIEEFERKLAASAALHAADGDAGDADADKGAGASGEMEPEVQPGAPPVYAAMGAGSAPAYAPAWTPEAQFQPSPPALIASNPTDDAPTPVAAFADPAGDMTVTIAAPQPAAAEGEPAAAEREVLQLTEASVYDPAPEFLRGPEESTPDIVAEARETLRLRDGKGGGVALLADEQRRYAYKVWIGPIMIAVGTLGPLALVLARISH
jgi:hypothetical protein